MSEPNCIIEADKIGSATSPLNLSRSLTITGTCGTARPGDVIVVRVLTDNATYNMLELPTGRLAKVNPGDVLVGVLGRRRALKGFVGDIPAKVTVGDELHLLNLGGVIGRCSGHHSSLNDAIKVEVIGLACDERGIVKNIADVALPICEVLGPTAPLVVIELGDGILGGYSVESIFEDEEFRKAMTALVFCASDYVGAWGGIELFRRRSIGVDLVAGSVTDSKMGEDYIQDEFGVPAANARRNGSKLFEIVKERVSGSLLEVQSCQNRER